MAKSADFSFWSSLILVCTVCTDSPVRMYTTFTVVELPRSGKTIWKMKFFPGQGKVKEFCGWPGKLRNNLESQRKVREFEN